MVLFLNFRIGARAFAVKIDISNFPGPFAIFVEGLFDCNIQ